MRHLSIAPLLAAALVTSAAGQTPAQRTLVEAFRDSIGRSVDTVALARLERGAVQRVRGNRGTPADHLRLGYLTLRLAELGRTSGYDDAASEFQWVARVEPGWVLGWYGLGLAEYGVARGRGNGVPVVTALEPAARAMARAIQVDPRIADRLVADAVLARRQRDPGRSLLALEALRLAGRGRTPAPTVLAALGQLERDVGDARAALRAFDAWLPRSGRQRGLALLEVARTRFLLGRADGTTPYFDGAVFDDSAGVRHYRDDIALVASADELDQYDRTVGSARADFLRRFWAMRDRAELRRDGERLQEHYRRVYYARRTFPLPTPGRSRVLDETVTALEPGFDDRGIVLVRHGEPDDRVVMSTFGVEPNESWRYHRNEGDLVLHFVARHDPEAYRLVESLFDVAETALTQPIAGGGGMTQGQEMLLRSRESLSPLYSPRAAAGAAPKTDFRITERAVSRASLVAAVTTDDFRPRYRRPLAARIDPVLFERSPAGTVLHLAFGVPFDSIGAAWLGTGLEYPVRLRLTAFDLAGRTLVELDSVVRPETAEVARTRWLGGVVSAVLPDGRLRLRVAIEDGDTVGAFLPLRSLELGVPSGKFELSDLAVGERDGLWQAALPDGRRVALAPDGRLRRGAVSDLAYLVRGPGGVRLRAELTLARIDADPGVALSRRREIVTTGEEMSFQEPIDTRKLKPGLYRAEVTLFDGQGGVARRWREFEVVEVPKRR